MPPSRGVMHLVKKRKDDQGLSEIGKTSRAIAFLTVIMLFSVVIFSFYMSYHLNSVIIMVTLIPSAFGAYVIVERASFRRSETVDVVKLQQKNAKRYTPDQMTNLVDTINKHELSSDSTGESKTNFDNYSDTFTDSTIMEGDSDG